MPVVTDPEEMPSCFVYEIRETIVIPINVRLFEAISSLSELLLTGTTGKMSFERF